MLNIFKIKIDIFFLHIIIFNEVMLCQQPDSRKEMQIYNMKDYNDGGWWKPCLKCKLMCATYGDPLYPICERCNSN